MQEQIAARSTLREEHEGRQRALELDVAGVTEKADAVERELYSGSAQVSRELSALQAELESLRRRQAELEDEVLVIMEQVEVIESEVAGLETRREELGADAATLGAAIEAAEQEIDAQLADLERQKAAAAESLPEALRTAYERRRANPRLGGLAAVALVERDCSGCRISLPIHEVKRMRTAPDDAALSCSQCQRLLVR